VILVKGFVSFSWLGALLSVIVGKSKEGLEREELTFIFFREEEVMV